VLREEVQTFNFSEAEEVLISDISDEILDAERTLLAESRGQRSAPDGRVTGQLSLYALANLGESIRSLPPGSRVNRETVLDFDGGLFVVGAPAGGKGLITRRLRNFVEPSKDSRVSSQPNTIASFERVSLELFDVGMGETRSLRTLHRGFAGVPTGQWTLARESETPMSVVSSLGTTTAWWNQWTMEETIQEYDKIGVAMGIVATPTFKDGFTYSIADVAAGSTELREFFGADPFRSNPQQYYLSSGECSQVDFQVPGTIITLPTQLCPDQTEIWWAEDGDMFSYSNKDFWELSDQSPQSMAHFNVTNIKPNFAFFSFYDIGVNACYTLVTEKLGWWGWERERLECWDEVRLEFVEGDYDIRPT
jgi:hypothetical protein